MSLRQRSASFPGPRTGVSRVLLPVLLLCLSTAPSHAATSISQFGITWTFDRDYPSGQFANGDYWVVGPVKIVAISPRSETEGGRTINGSMVNPKVGSTQGYDSATYGEYGPDFDARLNVAAGVAADNPLTLPAGTSLISSISEPAAGARPQLKSAAILTVLARPAPEGSFRPPYVGTDKTLAWNRRQLDTSRLRSLDKVPGTPSLATVEAYFERPWIEQNTEWTGRYLHASENQPDYGRDLANQLAAGLLSLNLNYTPERKETLLVRLVQYGIDIYGVARAGGQWSDSGGHNLGRKMPLLLAGLTLGDAKMLEWADAAKHFIFQEDRQTWYVTAADVGRSLYTGDGRKREPYLTADIGLAEWGEQHTRRPNRDGRNWDAYYRDVVGGALLGHVLAARLMKAEGAWNWPALFDYADRYWSVEKSRPASAAGNAIRPFVHAMWAAYRQGLADSSAEAMAPAVAPSIVTAPVSQTVAPGGTATLGVAANGSGLAYQWFKDGIAIEGATADTLTIEDVVAADAGDYRVSVSNAAGTVTSGGLARLVVATPVGGRLKSVSVRAVARAASSPLIVGVIASGGARPVLVRAVGPSLGEFGIADHLSDPQLVLHGAVEGADQAIGSNDNWAEAGAEALGAAMASVGAFPLNNASLDSALMAVVSGARTVHVFDAEGRPGVALVEIYDLGGEDAEGRIVDVSARNHVGTDDEVLIAGFAVGGNRPKRLLIRGIGPGLKAYGVPGALADPRIEVHTTVWRDGRAVDAIVASNDDWAQAGVTTLQAAFSATGAFALTDPASKDAALVADLPAGIYTAILSGCDGGTGEGLIEVYEMP